MFNPIAAIIIDKFPALIKSDYPLLNKLLTDFFYFLEETGNPLAVLETFNDNTKIYNEADIFIDKIINEIGFDINNQLTISKHELVMHLKNFYLSKGTLPALNFLFKLLFNKQVDVSYPREKLFVTDQATYDKDVFIFTTFNNSDLAILEKLTNSLSNFEVQLKGSISKTICNVDTIIQIAVAGDASILKIKVDKPPTTLKLNEIIKIYNVDNDYMMTNLLSVAAIQITDPGYGYQTDDEVFIDNTILKGKALVKQIVSGGVTDIDIIEKGDGYNNNDLVVAEKGSFGKSFSAYVSRIKQNTGLIVAHHEELSIENVNFTIELWLKKLIDNEMILLTNNKPGEQKGFTLKILKDNRIQFILYGATSETDQIFTTTGTIKNEWTFLAVCRKDNKLRIFIRGHLYCEATITNGIVSTNDLKIGISHNETDPKCFYGYMNELTIYKNHGKFTESFKPFPNFHCSSEGEGIYNTFTHYSDIVLLCHFNGDVISNTFLDYCPNYPKVITPQGKTIYSAIHYKPCSIALGIGSNYSGPLPGTSSAFFTATGQIENITILNPGMDYITVPNLSVKSLFGTNAVLTADPSRIGQIDKIQFIQPFILADWTSTATTTKATATLTVVKKPYFETVSILKSFEGVLGQNCIITDSYYFQQFSYELHTTIHQDKYNHIIDKWLHPVGYVKFHNLIIESECNYLMPMYFQAPIFIIGTRNDIISDAIIIPLNPFYNLDYYKNLTIDKFDSKASEFDDRKELMLYERSTFMSQTLACLIEKF